MRHFGSIVSISATAVAALILSACGSRPSQVRTYSMGEKVEIGHLIYTVFETRWLPQIGEGTAARIPENRFFLVRVNATNSGSAQTTVPNFTIEDDAGNSFSELTNGTGVPQWIGFLREVRPAESAQGNVVFDAPPRHYKLRVSDESTERSALVDIPLSFGSETPEVPVPGSARKQ
jgi:hypothetical protein